MAHIFDGAAQRFASGAQVTLKSLWKYWYHFAIMFEALFILTTIDTGTRIGRFLLQEMMGKTLGEKWGRTDWWPGAIFSTSLIVVGWVFFILNNSMDAIWPMFGVANQMLAVIALTVVSAHLVSVRKSKYLWVTLIPMLFVFTTTSTGAVDQFMGHLTTVRTQLANPSTNWTMLINSAVTAALIFLMEFCTIFIILAAAAKVWRATGGFAPGLQPAIASK
jgi:carbon starvation protein